MGTDQDFIVARFHDLERELNAGMLERQAVVKTALIALVSGKHHFQLGPTGTGKSRLVRLIRDCIDGMKQDDYFEWLLTKYTTPEEIFGPPSLRALRLDDVYKRNVTGKLPDAKLVFLDEIFKANSSILNALLTVMNERIFHNADEVIETAVSTIFAAANELPQGDELMAMWDRCHFRLEVPYIQDAGNFAKLLTLRYTPSPVIQWEHIQAAKEMAQNVAVPEDVLEAFVTLRKKLKENQTEMSDRRFVDCMDIVKAVAFLDGRQSVDVVDMRFLRHVAWNRVQDQRSTERCVLELANPIDRMASDLLEQVNLLGMELDEAIKESDNPRALARLAVDIHKKLQLAKAEATALKEQEEKAGSRRSEVLKTVFTRFPVIGKVMVEEVFGE